MIQHVWDGSVAFQNIPLPWNFPDGAVVKNPPSNAEGMGLITGRGTKILYAVWPDKIK